MPIQRRKTDRTRPLDLTDNLRAAAQKFAAEADWQRSLPGSVLIVWEWDDTIDILKVIEARPDGVIVVEYKDGTRQTCGRESLVDIARVHWPNNTSFARGSLFGTPSGSQMTIDDLTIIDGKPHQAVYEEYLVW